MDTYFDGQRDDEEILFVWRRHPWTLLKPALIVIALTWGTILSLSVFGASAFTSLLVGLWLITIPILVGYTWFIWWNDLYLLTTLRLVDVDQKRIFHRLVTELPLENVQDVTYEQRGPIQSLLNFGTVAVRTASGSTEIDIAGVTDPQAVQQAILRTVQKLLKGEAEPTKISARSSRVSGETTDIPKGTITFLFSDMVGSSTLWEKYSEAMKEVMAEHDDQLATIIKAHDGVVFKTMGDSMCAAFEAPAQALTAAAELQRSILKTRWKTFDPLLPPIRIRIGIHSGSAQIRGGDYFGPTVNRVARIASLGNASDILLSEATKTLVEDMLPAKARLLDRGRKKLKGLARPEHLYQLSVDDLSDLKRIAK